MQRRHITPIYVALIISMICSLATSCSSQGDISTDQADPLTDAEWVERARSSAWSEVAEMDSDQAELLARSLYSNAQSGQFNVYATIGPAEPHRSDASTLEESGLIGQINLKEGTGRLVDPTGFSLEWNKDGIIPNPDQATNTEYLTEIANTFSKFGSAQPDNPVLIAQNGAKFIFDDQSEATFSLDPSGGAIMSVNKQTGTTHRALIYPSGSLTGLEIFFVLSET